MPSGLMSVAKSLGRDAKVIFATSEVIARLFLDTPSAQGDKRLVVSGNLSTGPCRVQGNRENPITELESAESFLRNLSAVHASQRAMLSSLKNDHEPSCQENVARQSYSLSAASEELEDVASAVAGCVQDVNSRALIFRQSIVELRKVTLEAAIVSLRASVTGKCADEAAALAAKTILRGSHHHSRNALLDNLTRLQDAQGIFKEVLSNVDASYAGQVALKMAQAVEKRAAELRHRPRSYGVNTEFLGHVRIWLNGYAEGKETW